MATSFRKGAVGALLDEYEKALSGLKAVIATIPDDALAIITDSVTEDDNCRSVQTILTHVVHAGYGYATSIHNSLGNDLVRPPKVYHQTIAEYNAGLDGMFNYTERVFSQVNDNDLEQFDDTLKIKTGWGQRYDIEQITEHAIVHVLRHRRQIEKILATTTAAQ